MQSNSSKISKTVKAIIIFFAVVLFTLAILWIIDNYYTNGKLIINLRSSDQSEETEAPTSSKKKFNVGYKNTDNDETLESEEAYLEEDLTVDNAPKPVIGAWMPYWAMQSAYLSLQTSPAEYYSVSPVFYEVGAEGSFKNYIPDNFYDIMYYCDAYNIKVIPSIAQFNANDLHAKLQSDSAVDQHVQEILYEIDTYDFDGIDLDYESIKYEDQAGYFKLIKDLSEALHERGKILSVTVMAQWQDIQQGMSLQDTRKVQDWNYIGQYADEVRIMAYDYTWQTAEKPGPIAPISWIEEVLKFAVKRIPREKIWLGVHLSSYEWIVEDNNIDWDKYNIEEIPASTTQRAVSYTYDSIINRISIFDSFKTAYNTRFEEQIATYDCYDGQKCVLFYQVSRGVTARENLAQEYGIRGIYYWRLGEEGELL